MEYNSEERAILLKSASDSIAFALSHKVPPNITLTNYSPHLTEKRGCFVTLHLHNKLRGCIGSLIATQPLIVDVTHNACRAAFNDPRFPALSMQEFSQIALDISVLTTPQLLPVTSEADLLSKLQPGVHGLILADQGRRATFLPSVWSQLPKPADFVIHLKNKAGWPSDYWSPSMVVETYTAELIA